MSSAKLHGAFCADKRIVRGMELLDKHREYILRLCAATGKSKSALATGAGLRHTTITRIFKKNYAGLLRSDTIAKLEAVYGIPLVSTDSGNVPILGHVGPGDEVHAVSGFQLVYDDDLPDFSELPTVLAPPGFHECVSLPVNSNSLEPCCAAGQNCFIFRIRSR